MGFAAQRGKDFLENKRRGRWKREKLTRNSRVETTGNVIRGIETAATGRIRSNQMEQWRRSVLSNGDDGDWKRLDTR